VRFQLNGDIHHFIGHGHFQIHARLDGLAQNANIAIGDMTTVFAQVHRDPVSPCLLGNKCRLNRIRILGSARVT
jgi:hypothetical protein